jgi:hypothetical protein
MLTDLDYDLLSAYIDDALTESERTALESRLQSEPELRGELDELRATVTLLNNLPTLKAPRDFTLDARYARRSSTFFFTSAAFTALSSAAAIILFALGAYLFIGRSGSQAPVASTSQEAQFAFLATSTTATTLDKAAATGSPEALLQNEIAITETTVSTFGGIAANDALVNPTLTAESSLLPAQPPLVEPNIAQPPDTLAINPTLMPTAGFLTGSQQRTEDATETAFYDQYTAPSSAAGAVGAVAPSPMDQADGTGGEANASSAFAATLPPVTATTLPTATVLPTNTASPTLTSTPSATLTDTPLPTDTVTPAATDSRKASQPPESAPDFLPLIVVVLGVVFLIIAVITTVIRRRNRS